MTKDLWMRWLGELAVIVVGVVVALAVDDRGQDLADRRLEANLLERLQEDLVADAGDLAWAQVTLARRQWLYGAITETLAGVDPSTLQPPDSLIRADWALGLMEAAERRETSSATGWRPHEEPLRTLAGGVQFDLADDSFQEMLVSGALRALRNQGLRASILAYYRTAEDNGANVDEFDDQYCPVLIDLLLDAGVSLRDPMDLDRLAALAREHPRLAVQFRFAADRSWHQANFLDRIKEARLKLESALAG
jgi:hypothetical protein